MYYLPNPDSNRIKFLFPWLPLQCHLILCLLTPVDLNIVDDQLLRNGTECEKVLNETLCKRS